MGDHQGGSQLAFKELASPYRVRRPESTVLYQTVAGNLRTFETLVAAEGRSLPKHISQEFEAFLKCGILAYGFLRLKCEDCKSERLVAFSCKKRGFCSSCGGKRMAESAAHLVDEVFPKVGIRQWVLSFPMPIRYIMARHPKHQSRVLTIVHRAISTYIQNKARHKGFRSLLQPGAVTLIQRFGGSLNLNVHYHMLFMEGGFYESNRGPRYWWVDPPTDAEVSRMVATLSHRIVRYLKRKGYFQADVDGNTPEEDLSQNELIPELQAASVKNRIALGERKGAWVRRLGSIGALTEPATLTGPQCASHMGFSLHAAVYCAPWERYKLEKLCRYITRPAVAEERLALTPSGDVILKLKTPYRDGTTSLRFSGVEFVEKLAALVPPPRIHLTRFFGCLAPHAKIRSEVVPKKEESQPESEIAHAEPKATEAQKRKRKSWAELLARVFNIDILKCDHCHGEMKILSAILETKVIEKILSHLKLPHKPPDIAPSRIASQLAFT